MNAVALNIHGEEFVVIPKRDYDRLRGIPDGSVDAVEFARTSIANDLRAMREAAGLTQVELAKRLKMIEPFASTDHCHRVIKFLKSIQTKSQTPCLIWRPLVFATHV